MHPTSKVIKCERLDHANLSTEVSSPSSNRLAISENSREEMGLERATCTLQSRDVTTEPARRLVEESKSYMGGKSGGVAAAQGQ